MNIVPPIASAAEWFNHTTLHPVGIASLVVLGVAMLAVPRRLALAPLVILVCVVPTAQRFVFATLDFDFLRVMIIFGWVRLVIRGEFEHFAWKRLDTILVTWLGVHTLAGMLLMPNLADGVNRLGHAFDALGIYFLCRLLVRDWQDVRAFARCVALISMPVAAAFLVERLSGRNMFAALGGVQETTIIRAGRLRCQGPFTHPIVAGVFWAALAPIIAALGANRGWDRLLAAAGLAASGFIVLACASSTPLGSILFGAGVALLFPIRHWLWVVRWTVVTGLVLANFAMAKPIWHLLARIDLVSGSTGWYRYRLIDDFIRNFDDWWLIGTTSRAAWWSEGGFAITNEYVLQGINGGLLTLALFIGILLIGFRSVGATMRREERLDHRRPVHISAVSVRRRRRARTPRTGGSLIMAWALGVTLCIHAISFLGVSYFGQAKLVWYLTLALIASMAPRISTVRSRLHLRSTRSVSRSTEPTADDQAPCCLPTG